MRTQTVTLPPPLEEFVESRVRSGRYANADEVVQAGLRLLEEDEAIREAKIVRLREAAQVGIDDIAAGRFTEFSVDDVDMHVGKIADEVRRQRQTGG